jgi:hypothetical protein
MVLRYSYIALSVFPDRVRGAVSKITGFDPETRLQWFG